MTKFSMPEIFGDPVETEKEVIGGAAPLLPIVTGPSLLLFAIKEKDGRIWIGDHLDWRFEFYDH